MELVSILYLKTDITFSRGLLCIYIYVSIHLSLQSLYTVYLNVLVLKSRIEYRSCDDDTITISLTTARNIYITPVWIKKYMSGKPPQTEEDA